MPARDQGDVFSAIERGTLDPVYCLHGAERFLIDRCLTALRSAVLGAGGTAGLSYDVFDLKENALPTVLAAARTLPMLGKRRLVVARGIDQLKSEDLEPVTAYAADPNPSTCLVLVGEKVDGRLRAFLALRKAGFLHEMGRLKDHELPGWVKREAQARKIAIDVDAARALAEAAGPDLGCIVQALEQTAIYAGAGQPVLRPHVEEVVADTRERSVFDLLRAIGEGDVAGALTLVTRMTRDREPPLRIQFMLARQLRQIWRAKEMERLRAPRGEIASAVGMSPYYLDDVLVPARRMSDAILHRSFRRLYQSDKSLKSSRIDAEVQIARLVRHLAEDVRQGAPPSVRNR